MSNFFLSITWILLIIVLYNDAADIPVNVGGGGLLTFNPKVVKVDYGDRVRI